MQISFFIVRNINETRKQTILLFNNNYYFLVLKKTTTKCNLSFSVCWWSNHSVEIEFTFRGSQKYINKMNPFWKFYMYNTRTCNLVKIDYAYGGVDYKCYIEYNLHK